MAREIKWTIRRLMERTKSEGDCIVWTGSLYKKTGYGAIGSQKTNLQTGQPGFGRSHTTAHRLAWILRHGPVPSGLFVIHSCDNRRCVKDEHLRLGTAADNSGDMVSRGRSSRGVQRYNRKTNPTAVRMIRKLKSHFSSTELASIFGLAAPTIRDIQSRRLWRHVQ